MDMILDTVEKSGWCLMYMYNIIGTFNYRQKVCGTYETDLSNCESMNSKTAYSATCEGKCKLHHNT